MITSSRTPAQGFTLMELLTVIAIVGVLAAVAIPVIGHARQSASEARGMSNIHQLVIAHLEYAADNRGMFPPKYLANVSPVWQAPLVPYLAVKNAKADQMYSLRQNPESIFNVPDSKPAAERKTSATSIARNYNLREPNWNYRLNAVQTSANTLLLGECVEANLDEMGGLKADGITPVASSVTTPGFRRADGNAALMGFVDGHVGAISRDALRGDRTAAAGNLWRWW